MRRVSRILALGLVALAAGCGGGDGDGGAAGGGTATDDTFLEEDVPNDPTDTIEGANLGGASEAGNICVNLPLPELARQYGVEPTKDAVADAVAKDLGGDAAQQRRHREECLMVLE